MPYYSDEQMKNLWHGLARMLAHDMGTPLSSLMGWLELIPAMKNPERAIKEMNISIERLSQLSNRLDFMGKAGKLTPICLTDITTEVLKQIKRRFPGSSDLQINAEIAPAIIISAQKDLLSWAFECILRNAIDAIGQKPGKIDLETQLSENTVKILTSDTGCGIPPENLVKIFDPGFSSRPSGRGVGLSLAKYIIDDLHSGELKVEKSAPNMGTVVSVKLDLYEQENAKGV